MIMPVVRGNHEKGVTSDLFLELDWYNPRDPAPVGVGRQLAAFRLPPFT
jgi:hypothetical protein